MSWLDIVILLPLIIGLVRGMMKGLVTEIIAILAVVFGFIGAKLWGAAFSAWITTQFTWPQPVCDAVAYALLFLAITLALNIVGRLISKLLKAINLGWMNRLLGGAFGVVKWALIVLAVVFCVNKADEYFHFLKPELKANSLLYSKAVIYAVKALDYVKSNAPKTNLSLPDPSLLNTNDARTMHEE